MKIAVFSSKSYDEEFLRAAAQGSDCEFVFFETRLNAATAALARGCRAVCAFVNDRVDEPVISVLRELGVGLVALRCSGYNNVDLAAAERLGVVVARVPAYSPHAVAELTVALMLSLDRKLHKAYNRVREGNFNLEGLLGAELYHRTVGIVGTGKIGGIVARILAGFGCRLLAYDLIRNSEVEALGARYVTLDELCRQADIITLHCPLTPGTYRIINEHSLGLTKPGVMLINTSRGKLVDTEAVIRGLKSGRIGAVGFDVYEEEEELFFEDLSNQVIQDDVFARMLTFPNVIITGHQGYFTRPALETIARQTIENILAFGRGETPPGVVQAALGRRGPPLGG